MFSSPSLFGYNISYNNKPVEWFNNHVFGKLCLAQQRGFAINFRHTSFANPLSAGGVVVIGQAAIQGFIDII